jgi:hypothetical protein
VTESQTQQAEQDAQEDAQWLRLALLLALIRQPGRVRFDAASDEFILDGRRVHIDTIREYLLRIEKRVGARLTKLTDDLAKKRISVNEWQRAFERYVTSSHILASALAVGGIAAAVRNADVQARIDSELRYADAFAEEIRNKQAGTPAQIRARAKSYLMAVPITYGIIALIVRKVMGTQTEARRVRRASESCPGCVEWAAKGWMPIERMKPLGQLQCRSRCRCYIEYR